MRCIHFTTVAAVSLFTVAASALEPAHTSKVSGVWKLVKVNDDGDDVERPSSGTIRPIPLGVGHTHLHDGEFLVPGEVRGSKRHTLPDGFHFRVEPVKVEGAAVVADILLCYTTIREKSEVGFVAQKEQSDGRYSIPLDKPYSLTLRLRDGKTAYKLELRLHTE